MLIGDSNVWLEEERIFSHHRHNAPRTYRRLYQERLTAMNPIIKLLYDIRLEKGWTQEELAVRLGKHVNQIITWESGVTNPHLDSLTDWANALGYEFDLHLKEPANVK